MNLSNIAQHRTEDHVADWTTFVQAFRNADCGFATAYGSLFAPLHAGAVDELMVVAQLGQSLDGRIATPTGHSKYINGTDGLDHLHRLRALGGCRGGGRRHGTGRRSAAHRAARQRAQSGACGPRSAGRLPPQAKLLTDDGTRRIVIGCEAGRRDLPEGVEYVALAKHEGQLAPSMVLTELAARGFRRILIEGGADTISRFAHAGCLDRLHVVVAPIILGAGRPGINLPAIERVDQAMRAPMRAVALGDEVLFDCDLSAQRRQVGCAKKST